MNELLQRLRIALQSYRLPEGYTIEPAIYPNTETGEKEPWLICQGPDRTKFGASRFIDHPRDEMRFLQTLVEKALVTFRAHWPWRPDPKVVRADEYDNTKL